MVVFNNPYMTKILKLIKKYDEILKLFGDRNLICNLKHEQIFLKENHDYLYLQNKHNIQLFTQINGQLRLGVFNPKHETDIKNKNNHETKNGHKLILNLVYYYIFLQTGTIYTKTNNDLFMF